VILPLAVKKKKKNILSVKSKSEEINLKQYQEKYMKMKEMSGGTKWII